MAKKKVKDLIVETEIKELDILVLLQAIPSRLRTGLEMRYGINCKSHTFKEIADHFSVSTERARQIVAKAMRKLKAKYFEPPLENLKNLGADEIPIYALNLSVRAHNALKHGYIKSVADILREEKNLLLVKNLGIKSYQEIKNIINSIGFENKL